MKELKKPWTLVLVICGVVTLLCVVMLATNFFGLRDRPASAAATPAPTDSQAVIPVGSAALDYQNSGEYRATAAWLDFRAGYDTDGSILNSVIGGGNGSQISDRYEMYLVYSEAMITQLEQLLSEYSLRLHSKMSFCYTPQELYTAAGTDAFLWSDADCVGFIYDDGSFHYNGTRRLTGAAEAEYQLDRQMRGVFAETLLPVECEGEAKVWDYTAADGTVLHLSQNAERSCLFAALPRSFVSVSVAMGGAEADSLTGLSSAGLESFADAFLWQRIG